MIGQGAGSMERQMKLQPDWKLLPGLAREEVRETLGELPPRLREEARRLPVSYERRPNRAMVADGIEPDTLGLFVGPGFDEEESSVDPMPPQILLFLENIWEAAEGDPAKCRMEIRVTYLHELGHFLGLGEDDLDERGLS